MHENDILIGRHNIETLNFDMVNTLLIKLDPFNARSQNSDH